MMLVVMLFPSHLDVLVYELFDVFVGRHVPRYLIDYIPSSALNDVFNSIVLEAIVPMLLRGR